MKRSIYYLFLIGGLLLTGCRPEIMDGPGMVNSYKQITQEEAVEMMKKNDGHIVVDVRRQDEFDSGHIPGAICIPNESITNQKPAELPDLDQIILIYCRSGRRSKEASQKLFDMGYKNVYEFGGIIDWKGEVVMEKIENHATLVINVGEKTFYAALEDNLSAKALVEKLSPTILELDMHDYGGFEKVAELPWTLPRSDERITAKPGDIILYQGNQITVYYGENTWELTRIASIGNVTGKELLDALGEGDVKVKMNLEWDE